MSMSHCIGYETDLPFVRCYEEVKYRRLLAGLEQYASVLTISDLSLSLVGAWQPYHLI